ncbi:MAG: alpha/beta hydrolase [Fibrobacteraceae bacterium]|nr:alpha/beta hydrolase [Fibrobacteraceae bacterium]
MIEKYLKGAAVLFFSLSVSSMAQGFGGFGGFGGDQSGSTSIEYSEKFADLDYVGDKAKGHLMDIYLPKETKDSYPVVAHFYGSAWSMNDYKGSADLNTICAALLKKGFAVAVPNYRSYSDSVYPAQIHDVKAAIRFLRGNASKYKLDTSFVGTSGFSSGAQLSALAAVTNGMKEGSSGSVTVDLEGSLGEFTDFSSRVDAECAWSGPHYLVVSGGSQFEEGFIGVKRSGNEDKWKVAEPATYADKDDPPFLLFHGTSDQIVSTDQSEKLDKALKDAGAQSEFVSVAGGQHGSGGMYDQGNLDKMTKFFSDALEAKKSAEPPMGMVPTPWNMHFVKPGYIYNYKVNGASVLRQQRGTIQVNRKK